MRSTEIFQDAHPIALLALASYAVCARRCSIRHIASNVADARTATLLVSSLLTVVLADARPDALLAAVSLRVVLADA